MRLLYWDKDGELRITSDLLARDLHKYAILSHTWGLDLDEVNFKDLADGAGKGKAGYEKIRFCGERASLDGLKYFWVDTCCIDKSNLTELTEAINSMFRWYQNSTRCYAYLSDTSAQADSSQAEWEASFRKSRWFTRGWTLQELIAPRNVEFFSQQGVRLGDRNTLLPVIEDITGLPVSILAGKSLSDYSVPERISWSATRSTTREEDRAYSLLGICNVHMPLIYGEGEDSAFKRLKQEAKKAYDGTLRPKHLQS